MNIRNDKIVQFNGGCFIGDTISFLAFGIERKGYVSKVEDDGRISAVFTADEKVFGDAIVDVEAEYWFRYGRNNIVQHSPVYPIGSARVVIVEKFLWPFKNEND